MGSVALPMSDKRIALLFVCMGNICRSPALMAEFRYQAERRGVADRFIVDSCALTPWYLGRPVDPRMVEAAKGKPLVLEHSARQISDEDFDTFDYILAVDREVLSWLQSMAADVKFKGQVLLATAYSRRFYEQEISDPYYGGADGFAKTLEMAEDSCRGLLDHLLIKK